jgi:hypothetical protein
LIRSRQDFRDAYEIFGGVDVVGAAYVATFNERDEVGMRAEEGAGPGVTVCQSENFGPVLTGDQDRIARAAAIGSDRNAGTAAGERAISRAETSGHDGVAGWAGTDGWPGAIGCPEGAGWAGTDSWARTDGCPGTIGCPEGAGWAGTDS